MDGPLLVTTRDIDYGENVIGFASVEQFVQITNVTGSAVEFTSAIDYEVAPPDDLPPFFPPFGPLGCGIRGAVSLDPGASCTIDLTYLSYSFGSHSDVVTVTTSTTGATPVVQTSAASVQGSTIDPIAVPTSSIVFPPTLIGETSTQDIVLTNTSDKLLYLQMYLGELGPGFTLTGTTCGDDLGGSLDRTCAFTVTFAPTEEKTYSIPSSIYLGFSVTAITAESKTYPLQITGTGLASDYQRFSSQPAPRITGSTTVGSTLTARSGLWQPQPVTLSYQWLRDGRPILDATGSTYVVDAIDARSRLSVVVTGSAPGFVSASTTSGPTAPARNATFRVSGTKLTGQGAVGATLEAQIGTWSPQPDSVRYEWLRNGVLIDAYGPTYTVRPEDRGARISVVVTGFSVGYDPAVRRTAPITIR